MRILLIDDIREYRADRVCRTYEEGLDALNNDGPWDLLLLDNDLGDRWDPSKTGYGLLCWLALHREKFPRQVVLVTAHPTARQRLEGFLKSYSTFDGERWTRVDADLPPRGDEVPAEGPEPPP